MCQLLGLTEVSPSIRRALKQLHELLQSVDDKWLVGGSCGLLLQGIQLTAEPRDLDIYADAEHVEQIASLLKPYATDEPVYSETPIYRSTLSHYCIAGVQIELVGGFQVIQAGTSYLVSLKNIMKQHQSIAVVSDARLGIMPLAHELVFNLLRNRADRYELIAAKMRLDLPHYLPALKQIIEGNVISEQHLRQLSELLKQPVHEGKWL